MPPDEPNDEEQLEEEPEDNGTPFRPADDLNQAVVDPDANEQVPTLSEESSIPSSERGGVDDTHPQTDTNMPEQEWYDEGIAGAVGSGVSEPNSGDAVIGYHGAGKEPDDLDDDVPDGFHEENDGDPA